jgi:hypothetical protein
MRDHMTEKIDLPEIKVHFSIQEYSSSVMYWKSITLNLIETNY